jgi:hypothetical protein
MNNPQIPDRITRDLLLPNRSQVRREMSECNQDLAKIEAQLDRSNVNLTLAASKISEPAFSKIWDNPEDAAYDQL